MGAKVWILTFGTGRVLVACATALSTEVFPRRVKLTLSALFVLMATLALAATL